MRAVAASSVIAAICISADEKVISANPFLLRLLGHASIQSLRERDFKTEILARSRDWQHWERARATHRVTRQEITFTGSDGRDVVLVGDIWAASAPNGGAQLLGLFADTTGARQLDAALEHAARSEALRSLTSGIVHDFNNLLTVLVGNLYLVAEGVRDNPTLFEQTKRARDVAKRGTDLIGQLLSFSRDDREGTKSLNTSRIIANLKPILDHALGARISLVLDSESDVSSIEASAAQLESVIVNLAVNARDAIEADGTITISARNCSPDQAELKKYELAPGDYVRITVADDGCGIPETLQSRVFEPFFSTKGKHQGTGLGLSMVKRFAAQHGGAVALDSRPGVGTTITLLLPASSVTPEDSSVLTMPLKLLPTGNERVLVLADDTAISKTLEESLSILGYAPRVVAGHAELQRVMSLESFNLVIIDFSSHTEAERRQLIATVRNRAPDGRILAISNHSPGNEADCDATAWLKKPFSLKDLATSVRGILDSETHA